jgi:hypothetical protein
LAHRLAGTLFLSTLAALCAGVAPDAEPREGAAGCKGGRAAYIASGLTDSELVALIANIAAADPDAVVLLDTPSSSTANRDFLTAYRPDRVVPVGRFALGVSELERRLEVRSTPVFRWGEGMPPALWKSLFPRADRVVVCPAEPRRLLLQASCLAGALGAPLYVTQGSRDPNLRGRLERWHATTIYAVGAAEAACREQSGALIHLADEDAVAQCCLYHQSRRGPIANLVVANPADVARGFTPVSALAPYVAVTRRAVLLLTDEQGDDVEVLVSRSLRDPRLCRADGLILLADLKAVPMLKRPNPVPGKDVTIEMEPLTPVGREPFTFATGRLFHEDPAVVALMLARPRLLAAGPLSRRALVISNPGGGLPLLEAFSQNTVKELLNVGYQTTSFLGEEASVAELRRLLPEQDVFLWEGHFQTMVKHYGLHTWTEPLRPSLIFLQSCLALSESKAQPFLERGAVGVVGSSTRIYSATGGACTLAYFDALLYDGQSLGGSLRQAKNFLLAYALLKEKRLGKEARLGGANLRSAWAFTLWGDPTLTLPRPAPPDDSLTPVRHQVKGNTIIVKLPDAAHGKTRASNYRAEMLPNGRLAGLLSKDDTDDGKRLVPLVFAEIHLPHAPPGVTPRLLSRVPSNRWVFCWDSRRRSGYLLIVPRDTEGEEIRFHVTWEAGTPTATERVVQRNADPSH